MPRISPQILAQAITLASKLNLQDKEKICDEIFKAQPHLLGSVLTLHRLSVSLEKIDFALNILMVCFLAMKASGHTWHLVSQDEQEQQMARLAGSIKFGADLNEHLQYLASQQYIEAHDEKYLLAFVINECTSWLKTIQAVESDKYVLLAVINLVNCIAIRPTQNTQKKRRSR